MLPVSPTLALPISLDGFRVGLPVLPGIVGMTGPPFLLTVPTDLVVLGIGVKLAAMILPSALPLAIRSTADKLVGMITGKLKELLAVAAVAIAHQAGSGSGCVPSIVNALLRATRNTPVKTKTSIWIRSKLAPT